MRNEFKGSNAFKRKNPRFWFNGKLISKKEHDALSVDAIRESNDLLWSKKEKK